MTASDDDLPLFSGPHIPRIRFERALDRLDLAAAVADAPVEWRDALSAMAAVLEDGGSPARLNLRHLVRCRVNGWPQAIERTWQRLVGLRLDAYGIPRRWGDELAAEFLLRGGERTRACKSLHRHLDHHPCDTRAWRVLAEVPQLPSREATVAAARCAFHGGPILDGLRPILSLVSLVEEDEVTPVGPWLLSYGWFAGVVGLEDVHAALAAEKLVDRPPLPVAGDPRAFAWYLADAGGQPFGPRSVGVVEARQRLQRISPVAFRRYLDRVSGKVAEG